MLLLTASSWKSSLKLKVPSDRWDIQEMPLKAIWPMNLSMVPPYIHHLEAHNWFCDPGLMLHRTSWQIILFWWSPALHSLLYLCVPFKKKNTFAMPCSMWDLSSPTRDRTHVPAMQVWVLSTELPGESHLCGTPLWPSLFATYGKACSGL